MDVKNCPKQIPSKEYMDYRYKKDCLVRHIGLHPPPTIGSALECIRRTAVMLGKKQGFTPESIVIENRW